MRRFTLTLMILSFFAMSSFAQKMTIRTCSIQYGDVVNNDLNDVIMDGDPIHYVASFQVTRNYFIQILNEKKYKFVYANVNSVPIKKSQDFKIIIKDDDLNDYFVLYSYKEQTLTFLYSDGFDNLRLTKFTIDNIKVNYQSTK